MCGGILWRTHNIRAAEFVATLSIFFLLSLAVQYVGVEIYQLKVVSTLGPSRFLLWGYWFCAMAIAIVLAPNLVNLNLQILNKPTNWISEQICHHRWGGVLVTLMLIFTFAVLPSVSGVTRGDKLDSIPRERSGEMLFWLAGHTPLDSVFIAPPSGFLRVDIPIVSKRAMFYGNGFPFHESCFKEYMERRALVDGTAEEQLLHEGNDMSQREAVYASRAPMILRKLQKVFGWTT